jgi:hypothetical protein
MGTPEDTLVFSKARAFDGRVRSRATLAAIAPYQKPLKFNPAIAAVQWLPLQFNRRATLMVYYQG